MPQPEPIRIILVDSESDQRRRTTALLAGDEEIEVVGHARSVAEGYRLAEAVEPNVILLAEHYGGAAGLDFIRRVKTDLPTIYLLIISRSSDAQFLQAALLAGAQAFLSQPAPAEALLIAIKASRPKP